MEPSFVSQSSDMPGANRTIRVTKGARTGYLEVYLKQIVGLGLGFSLIASFVSLDAAEKFIVGAAWFCEANE